MIIALIAVVGTIAIAVNALSLVEPTSTLTTLSTTTEFGLAGFAQVSNVDYWSPASPMNVARAFSAVATLSNGSVLAPSAHCGAVRVFTQNLRSSPMVSSGPSIEIVHFFTP